MEVVESPESGQRHIGMEIGIDDVPQHELARAGYAMGVYLFGGDVSAGEGRGGVTPSTFVLTVQQGDSPIRSNYTVAFAPGKW